ncbi:MAG: DUF3494 domain-containing protein [Bacteroidetes bacterium]|nr:DUF3494 domain-containing protein [Bacteroidota bacterium]
MKKNILLIISILVIKSSLFAQAPTLGTAANFALFTSVGAITNTGISHVTGHVGSNSGAGTGFGNVNGVMHSSNGTTGIAAADLNTAYLQLNSAIPNYFHAPLLGNGDTLVPGVYSISGVTVLSGNLILNGQGDSNAVFIFQIQAAFSSNAASKVKLINGAQACNVFWKVEGLVDLASGTYMRGTIVANNAAINMHALDTLEGRALSTGGAIGITNVMAYTPIGCGSPYLTGPIMPTLGSASCFTLFTSNGALANAGTTNVTGDVGTNVGLTTGFNPLLVNGTIHPIPDGATAAAAADLLNAANLINIMPYDIELLYPAQFGNDLVLTPHTYVMNAATALTGNVYLNAQGNANAVFLIKIYGALSTSTFSNVILINGTQAKNVFWLVSGAVSINDYSIFNGTIISQNGAIDLTTGVTLNGSALTTNGAYSTAAITAISTTPCFALPVNWISFDGQFKQNHVELNWVTENAINNHYYTIERSIDGKEFSELNRVYVDPNLGAEKHEYTAIDQQASMLNFYRISQTDINGQASFYKTIKVVKYNNHEVNITHRFVGNTIEVQTKGIEKGDGFIELYTMSGQKYSSQAIKVIEENANYQIPMPKHEGVYILHVVLNGKSMSHEKIMVY